ncbi:DNA primase [Streptomyces sp. TRM S81-3]|uniref:DNA primase n=1 Tax=Streptomyces griseicoloratus TaxID=2752516 RepID=A0A926L205_9ACTN|nr:DNA primase [Streptomyces griseicoloratus]MBD0418713.1 DNA primase [Streptomyces griseicoloratus]
MNRVGLGLAVGAGYLLGRTRKMKLAVAVGSMVAGKRLTTSPRAVADLVSRQLRDNPQFKELGDQLRQDLSGVGKAASGAVVERQLDALADRLHGRTAEVRDRLSGVTSKVPGAGTDSDSDAGTASEEDEEHADEEPTGGADEESGAAARKRDGRGERPARKAAPEGRESAGKAPGKKVPAKRAGVRAPTRKTMVKKAQPAGQPARKKTAGAGSTAGDTRAGRPKGGGER